MSRLVRYTDEDIRTAVAGSVSIAGVMRLLGIKPAGGSHFHISKRIKRLGLDTDHFLGQGSRRGTVQPRKPAEAILVRRPPDGPRAKPHMLRRALIESGRPVECVGCGIGDRWRGQPLTLHVDHIDGDFSNCLAENLRFLCPNCHSQTATYCRKVSSREAATAA